MVSLMSTAHLSMPPTSGSFIASPLDNYYQQHSERLLHVHGGSELGPPHYPASRDYPEAWRSKAYGGHHSGKGSRCRAAVSPFGVAGRMHAERRSGSFTLPAGLLTSVAPPSSDSFLAELPPRSGSFTAACSSVPTSGSFTAAEWGQGCGGVMGFAGGCPGTSSNVDYGGGYGRCAGRYSQFQNGMAVGAFGANGLGPLGSQSRDCGQIHPAGIPGIGSFAAHPAYPSMAVGGCPPRPISMPPVGHGIPNSQATSQFQFYPEDADRNRSSSQAALPSQSQALREAKQSCPMGHELTRHVTVREGFVCDGACEAVQPRGSVMFSCRRCNHDVCERCQQQQALPPELERPYCMRDEVTGEMVW